MRLEKIWLLYAVRLFRILKVNYGTEERPAQRAGLLLLLTSYPHLDPQSQLLI